MSELQRSSTDRADGLQSRNRDIETVDQIFKATGGPADVIAELLRQRATLDVLEVGCGWGIALLQLAWRFREHDVSFHGVDIEPKAELGSSEAVRAFARGQGIVPEEAGSTAFDPPRFNFYDATHLEFPDESLDFIFSAVTIRFMRRKLEFIEETARVLRPGGKALLHVGESNWNYPHSVASDSLVLTPFTSRLILKYRHELIPLPRYFQLFAGAAFEFTFAENSRCILVLSKMRSGTLDLGATLNEELTMPGRAVPLVNRKGEVRGGVRSVYDISEASYRAMCDKGLLGSL